MSGQASLTGATALVNKMGGVGAPVASASTSPPTWVPGMVWYNTTAAAFSYWNGTAWVTGTEPLYIALLTGDPSASAGENGGYAQTIADLVEDTTAGYARQSVTFATYPAAYASGTTYTQGQQVTYSNNVYQLQVSSSTGTAPSGTQTSNTNWLFVSTAYPASVANSNTLTWSYTAAQANPVRWAALVTAASGTTGLLKYMWTLPTQQQVSAGQYIQAGPGSFILTES